MTCSQARRLLDSYLDNSLAEQEALDLNRHLTSCPACRREELELRAALDFVRQAQAPVPPYSLRKSVLLSIEQARTENRKQAFAWRFSPAFAALTVFLLLLGGNLFLTAWPLPRPEAGPAPPGAQMRTMIQNSELKQDFQAETEAPPQVAEDSAAAQQAGEALSETDAADIPEERPAIAPRLFLNILLVPLFIFFSWWAVSRRRVV